MTQSTVVYFSKFGNTRMVADRIANTLSSAGPVRVIRSDDLSVSDIEEMDLVIMSTPTHNMNLPKSVKPVIDELP
jgi:flavodoxin